MLKLKTERLDVVAVRNYAEHYAGRAACDVLVIEDRTAQGVTTPDGRQVLASHYCFVWTGQDLRQANELEMYAFRKHI